VLIHRTTPGHLWASLSNGKVWHKFDCGENDMKWMHELMYRYSFVSIPWDTGPREGLVSLVESGRVKPCRAIDLGKGENHE
jgi:hypothetical protein